jgi:hypothetical protein
LLDEMPCEPCKLSREVGMDEADLHRRETV